MKGYYLLESPTFEQWKKRPVYVVQCYTSRIADALGLLPSIGYRSLPGYRDTYAQTARDFIALSVRIDRMRRDVPSLVDMGQP